jgi:hypothetical protein
MKNKAFAAQSILRTTENLAKGCQIYGRHLSSRTRRKASCMASFSLVLLIVIAGCGSGGYNANNVTVTVTPATVTVPENSQVILKASVRGLCPGCVPEIDDWSITEDNGATCTWFETPPVEPCPAGTIQETAGGLSNSLTVTYFAPATAGTFHVVADTLVTFTLNKQGTSVVTISP